VALFITFEGGEGTGKTTHVGLLVERLRAEGHAVVALREPGGTPLGDYLREWLKAEDRPMTPEAELLLFAAARAELVRTVVRPALDAGTHVVLDRYADSTTVYQGYGRGLPMAQVRAANKLAMDGLSPDLTLLLEAALDETLGRALGRTTGRLDDGGRRFEGEDLAFHRRVRSGFRRLAKREPGRWVTLDTTGAVGDVHKRIWEAVVRALGS
jgi:dTMP kinase